MDAPARQGLILGGIVGLLLAAFFIWETGNWWSLILVPIAALMGMAPQLLKPKDMQDDE